MTDINNRYAMIGGGVIAALAFIIFIIILLSSGTGFERYMNYLVYMQESVTGINIDSPVEYNGVDVGRVSAIKLNDRNPQIVRLLLSIKKGTPVTQGTVAMLASRGITGISYIALKDENGDKRPLQVLLGEKYPVIKTAPSIFLRLDIALNLLTNNFRQINQSIQSLLDKENLQSIKDSLSNLDQITNTIAKNTEHINAILINTSEASKRLMPLMQTSIGTMRMLETQTLPETYRLLINVDDVTRNLAEIAEQIQQNPAVLVRGVNRTNRGPGEN